MKAGLRCLLIETSYRRAVLMNDNNKDDPEAIMANALEPNVDVYRSNVPLRDTGE